MLLILNLPFAPAWTLLLKVPKSCLYAGIMVFASFGVYAAGSSTVDLTIMLALGPLGYVMRRYGVPLAPVLIAVILGPLAEYSLRDAMASSGNDAAVLVSSPITVVWVHLWARDLAQDRPVWISHWDQDPGTEYDPTVALRDDESR